MDERLNLLTNEVVANIEEEFYVIDVEFDSTYCNKIFYDLALIFYSKNILATYKIEMYKFIKKCINFVDVNNKNDYRLFLDNLNFLLEIDCIKSEDLLKIKKDNVFEMNNQKKLLYAM